MYKILIITTDGCEACDIARANVDFATFQTSKDIEVEVKDWHDLNRTFLKDNKIEDYPTVMYYVGDKVVKKVSGTYPSAVYLRWIDMFFKI